MQNGEQMNAVKRETNLTVCNLGWQNRVAARVKCVLQDAIIVGKGAFTHAISQHSKCNTLPIMHSLGTVLGLLNLWKIRIPQSQQQLTIFAIWNWKWPSIFEKKYFTSLYRNDDVLNFDVLYKNDWSTTFPFGRQPPPQGVLRTIPQKTLTRSVLFQNCNVDYGIRLQSMLTLLIIRCFAHDISDSLVIQRLRISLLLLWAHFYFNADMGS